MAESHLLGNQSCIFLYAALPDSQWFREGESECFKCISTVATNWFHNFPLQMAAAGHMKILFQF